MPLAAGDKLGPMKSLRLSASPARADCRGGEIDTIARPLLDRDVQILLTRLKIKGQVRDADPCKRVW
jgi:hypothetical protein